MLILMHGPEPLILPAYSTAAAPTSSQPAATSQTQIFAAAGRPVPPLTGRPSPLQRLAAAPVALPLQHRRQGRQHVLAFAACATAWLIALLGLSELLLWRLDQRSRRLQRPDGLYLGRGEGQSAPHWVHRSHWSNLQVSPSAGLGCFCAMRPVLLPRPSQLVCPLKQRRLPAPVPTTCRASAQTPPHDPAPSPSTQHLNLRSTCWHSLLC